ncbi:MAG: Hpt domain-containing protein, partial [Burkholderiales bacterium]
DAGSPRARVVRRHREQELILEQFQRFEFRLFDRQREQNDLERVYIESHSLKGAVGSVEAPEVLKSVVDLETHARNHEARAAAAAFADAESVIQRLSTELSELVS